MDEYFQYCENEPDIPTLSGIALFCGFADRHGFTDQSAHPEFDPVIKNARARIEMGHEKRLVRGNPIGAIFALKATHGWREDDGKDKTPITFTIQTTGGSTTVKSGE